MTTTPLTLSSLEHDDPYRTSCMTTVTDVQAVGCGYRVVLDDTPFDPELPGGDEGSISLMDRSAVLGVTAVTVVDGKIVHWCMRRRQGTLAAGDRVHVAVNWAHRYNRMRTQSAASLLHAAGQDVLQTTFPAVGIPLEPDRARCVWGGAGARASDGQIDEIVAHASAIAGGGGAVTLTPTPREEAVGEHASFYASLLPPADPVAVASLAQLVAGPAVGPLVHDVSEIGAMRVVAVDRADARLCLRLALAPEDPAGPLIST
jgi:Ser-tRNA(Ala) deacylase AlaX